MKTITYPNGATSTYNDDIQVGDIVTTYNAGYHRVTLIVDRPNATPLFHYTKMYNDDGSVAKKFKNTCDASYVRLAQDTLEKNIKESQEKTKALESILRDIQISKL